MGICSLIYALLFSSIKYFAFYLQLTWGYFIVVIELIFSGLQDLLGLLQKRPLSFISANSLLHSKGSGKSYICGGRRFYEML